LPDQQRNIGLVWTLTDMDASDQTPAYSGEKARGGEIILRRTWERYVFIGGLVGILVLGAVLALIAALH
jgi:hypothetical protein